MALGGESPSLPVNLLAHLVIKFDFFYVDLKFYCGSFNSFRFTFRVTIHPDTDHSQNMPNWVSTAFN